MEFPSNYEDLARSLWKRRFWLLVPLILGVLTALGAIRLIPPRYRASTMILVESQKIPTDYVRPTVTTTLGERLRTIEQQIKNRANLERVISELGLYQEELAEYGNPDDLRQPIIELTAQLLEAAADLDFEKAASLRDQMLLLEKRELLLRG